MIGDENFNPIMVFKGKLVAFRLKVVSHTRFVWRRSNLSKYLSTGLELPFGKVLILLMLLDLILKGIGNAEHTTYTLHDDRVDGQPQSFLPK